MIKSTQIRRDQGVGGERGEGEETENRIFNQNGFFEVFKFCKQLLYAESNVNRVTATTRRLQKKTLCNDFVCQRTFDGYPVADESANSGSRMINTHTRVYIYI